MDQSTLGWLPAYCRPGRFLPTVQDTEALFSRPPLLFSDFLARALALLQDDVMRKLGLEYDPRRALPCQWKCAEEALFGVDLALYAHTGHFPFDKGMIGGHFNEASLASAVHHSPLNLDVGGSHVGYMPGPDGGTFGNLQRPLRQDAISTDCSHLMGIMAPFRAVYDAACNTILVNRPEEEQVMVSIPNEFLRPSWSSGPIKLLVDLESMCAGQAPHSSELAGAERLAGRSLFHASKALLDSLTPADKERLNNPRQRSIGEALTAPFFHIFDATAELEWNSPQNRLLPYMKYILAGRGAPCPLRAAVTHANIQHNKLTDCVRAPKYSAYTFASFTGVFIDIFDPEERHYVNLYAPLGLSIKLPGRQREFELPPEELHDALARVEPAEPKLPLASVLGYEPSERQRELFTYRSVG